MFYSRNVILLILICYPYSLKSLTLLESLQKDVNLPASIPKCILEVTRRVLFYQPTVVIYSDEISENTMNLVEILVHNIIPIILRSFNNENNKNNTEFLNEVSLLIVLNVDDCESVLNVPEIINSDNYNTKYLVIIDDSFHNCEFKFKEFGKRFDKFHLYDVTFLVKDEVNHVFVTLLPQIDPKTCEYDNNLQVERINICINGSLEFHHQLFPDKKPVNLKQCPFNVGLASMFPYSIIEGKKHLKNMDPLEKVEGSDVEILKIISNYFNASLRLYYIFRDEESPYIHLEYVPLLLSGRLDACAGGLYRIYGDLVSYSGVYSRQAIVWIYPAEREVRSWNSLLGKIKGLYIFFIFYISYCIIWRLFCVVDNQAVSLTNTLFYAFGALIGAVSLQDARSFKQKLLNIVYLVMCLYLSAYVSVQMYSYLTIVAPPEMYKTLDQLTSSGRVPYLRKEAKYFINDTKHAAFAGTSENCDSFMHCANKTLDNKGTTAILDGYFTPIQTFTAEHDEARVLSVTEYLLIVYHEMILRKDIPMDGRFQKVIRRLFEAGICDRLYLESIGILVDDKARIANKNMMTNSYRCESGCEITLVQLASVFYLWMIGCSFSFCVFVVEIIVKKEK